MWGGDERRKMVGMGLLDIFLFISFFEPLNLLKIHYLMVLKHFEGKIPKGPKEIKGYDSAIGSPQRNQRSDFIWPPGGLHLCVLVLFAR